MAKNSTDYLNKIAAMKSGYLDGLWSAGAGMYVDGAYQLTWLNAAMVQIIAIQAGQGIATETDKARARAVVAKLAASPCYTGNTWTHYMAGNGDKHSAVDQPVAESLYYAYKYRTQLALDGTLASTVFDILTVNRAVDPAYVYQSGWSLDPTGSTNNQDLADWGLARLAYAHMLGVSQTAYIRLSVSRFLGYIDTPYPGAPDSPFLFNDFGFRYLASFPFNTTEYGLMTLGKFWSFYPEIGSAMALTADEQTRAKAWSRHVLGQFQRNGYVSWDSGYGDHRVHTLSYWTWSIRALIGLVRGLTQNAGDAATAKFMLDAAVDLHTRMDTWASDAVDGAVSRLPFGTLYGGAQAQYNIPKSSSNAKFASLLALAVDTGVADANSSDPGNVWGWNWYSQDVHISTPAYDAASVPWAPVNTAWGTDGVHNQHYGISRLALPTGEILTSFGGYGRESFSLLVTRSGVTQIDTGAPATPATSQTIWLDGVQQARVAYDTTAIPTSFSTSVRQLATRTGGAYRAEVDTTFLADRITTTHRAVLTGLAGPASVVMSVPARKRGGRVTIEYVAVGGAVTTVWNGTTVVAAGSPAPSACQEIRLRWADGARITLTPISATLDTGAKVTALGYDPASYTRRQPDQDRSLLVYLADTTSQNVGNVEITFDVTVTGPTDTPPPRSTYTAGSVRIEDPPSLSTAGSVSVQGGMSSASAASVILQRAIHLAIWAEYGGESSPEVARDYLIALDETRDAAASLSLRGAVTDTAAGSATVQGTGTATSAGSVSVAQARTTSATGSASIQDAVAASSTASSVLADGGSTVTANASASVLDSLTIDATASTSLAARTTTGSTASLAWEAVTSTSVTGSVYLDTAGPEVTTATVGSVAVTDAATSASTASVIVCLAGERSATPGVSIFGAATPTSATASTALLDLFSDSAPGSVVVGADSTNSVDASIEIAPAFSVTASVIIGSPFQPSRSPLKLTQSPVVTLHASPTIRLVEGTVRNGFKLEVPYATNYVQTVEFYQADRTTPRDVSAFDVSLVVEADGAATGFTVTGTNGSSIHQKVFTFTAAQLVKMRRAARVTLNAGGETGDEDAASGTFIAA